jgi:hypothetical protein
VTLQPPCAMSTSFTDDGTASIGIAHARRSCSTYLTGSPLQAISMENNSIEEEIMRYKHLICSEQVKVHRR